MSNCDLKKIYIFLKFQFNYFLASSIKYYYNIIIQITMTGKEPFIIAFDKNVLELTENYIRTERFCFGYLCF